MLYQIGKQPLTRKQIHNLAKGKGVGVHSGNFIIFGDGPLGRICIDTLSSVSYSFWTFDIDAPPFAALWLGDEGGQDASAQPGRRLAPRWWRRVRPAARRCLKYEPAIPAGHDSVITSSVRS